MRRFPNIQLVLWRRRPAGDDRQNRAPALDKRPQSKESGRSGSNRASDFPSEDK